MNRLLCLAALFALAAAVPRGASAAKPFDVTIGGAPFTFNAFEHDGTIASWYGYNSPAGSSANPPILIRDDVRRSNAVVYTLVQANDGLYLVVILDKPGDGSGGRATMAVACGSGACATATGAVLDDASELLSLDSTGSGSVKWAWDSCCTDGMAYGPLTADTCFDLRLKLSGLDRVNELLIASRNPDGTANVFEAGTASDEVLFEGCTCPEPPSCGADEIATDTDGDECPDACLPRTPGIVAKCDGADTCTTAAAASDTQTVQIAWSADGECN